MYLGEIRTNRHALLAAAMGLGLGIAMNQYSQSLFGPALIDEFGWSRAQFALVGSISLLTVALVPFAGRFTDRFGPRVAAMVGFTAVPLGFVAFAFMTGNIIEFFAIWLVQGIFGILTTSLVFCRVVVERFDKARGLALSLLITAPPLVGAITAPLLGALIDARGWRAGYLALATVTATGGLIAVLMMGRGGRRTVAERPTRAPFSRRELGRLLRHPTLLLVVGGMLLVNVPGVFASSQLKLVVMAGGVSSDAATWMLSLYAIGVIVGRFLSGLALDRVPAHVVAIASLGLPAIGYGILAAEVVAIGPLVLAIMLIGLAQGAESDVGAYLISRRFDIGNFSLLLGFVTASIVVGTSLGAVLLSTTLGLSGGYQPFLIVSMVCTLAGAALFGLTGTARARRGTPDEAAVTAAIVDQPVIAGGLK